MLSRAVKGVLNEVVPAVAQAAIVFAFICVLTHPAYAQIGPILNESLPPATLAWVGFAGVIVHFAMSLLAPGTPPLPFQLSAGARAWIGTGLSTVSGLFSLLLTGATVQTAALTALGTLITAFVAHGPQFAKTPPSANAT